MKLSAVQIDALDTLRELGALSEPQAAMFIGKSRKQTMRALVRAGLVRWYPTPEHWKLTREGRDWLADEDARRLLAEHQAKQDAIVAEYRKGGA